MWACILRLYPTVYPTKGVLLQQSKQPFGSNATLIWPAIVFSNTAMPYCLGIIVSMGKVQTVGWITVLVFWVLI